MAQKTSPFSEQMKKSFSHDAILTLKEIRKEALPFFFGWIGVFTWMYCCFLPNGYLLFLNPWDISGYEKTITYIWLIVCPAITILFDGKDYVPKTFYSVCLAIFSFACMIFFDFGFSKNIFYILISISIGHIFASCVYGFFMILNNAEKFHAMLLGILFPKTILMVCPLVFPKNSGLSTQEFALSCCLITILICSLRFRKENTPTYLITKEPFPKKAYWLMAVVFIVLAINDVLSPLSLLRVKEMTGTAIQYHYFGGILLGLFFVVLLQKKLHLHINLIFNISFAFLVIGFVLILSVADYPILSKLSSFLFGISYSMGIVNIYYLAGFMAKKFKNITFFRIGILLSAIYYFYGFLMAKILQNTLLFMTLLAILMILIFFVLSPFFLKFLYDEEWIDDSYRQDVTFESRLRVKLKEANLSPKEIQVCECLLQGYTLRQSSAILGIAYSTVNTYCTAIYRKLNINSRTELLLMFQHYQNPPKP